MIRVFFIMISLLPYSFTKMNVFVLIPGLFLSPGSRGITPHLMTISPGYSGIPTQPPVREGTPHPLLLF